MTFKQVGTPASIQKVINLYGTTLKLKGVVEKDGVVSGYIAYIGFKPTSGSKGYLHKVSTTTLWNKPCAHVLAKIIRLLLVDAKTNGKYGACIWAEKLKFNVAYSEALIFKKLHGKYAHLGFTCTCAALATPGVPIEHIESSQVSQEVDEVEEADHEEVDPDSQASGLEFTRPALDCPALTDGESPRPSKGTIRNLYAAVCGLYVLQEIGLATDALIRREAGIVVRDVGMYWALSTGGLNRQYTALSPVEQVGLRMRGEIPPPKSQDAMTVFEATTKDLKLWAADGRMGPLAEAEADLSLARQRISARGTPMALQLSAFLRDFYRFKATYEHRLARQFFDFCTAASFGEARHSSYVQFTSPPASRSDAYNKAALYDPRSALPVLSACFNETKWGGSYGGPKWGNIVEAAIKYLTTFRHLPLVFADHVVDLTHNGGLAFNKGLVLGLVDMSASTYMEMLDVKRHASILSPDCKVRIVLEESVHEMYLLARFNLPDDETGPALPRVHWKRLSVVPNSPVQTVKWGTKEFKMQWASKHTKATSKPTPPKPPGPPETYPDARPAAS